MIKFLKVCNECTLEILFLKHYIVVKCYHESSKGLSNSTGLFCLGAYHFSYHIVLVFVKAGLILS